MIAALPMYDRPETRAANDRFWSLIRDTLGEGPERLTRDADPWDIWQSPDLLLAQTCGLPYRARLHGRVTLVATPVHALPDMPSGHYCSVLVARADDPRAEFAAFASARLAYNEPLSQSGWAAPQSHAAAAGFRFGDLLHTGSHRASARAVAEGRADIAALDAVTWKMIRRWDGFATRLRVVERTAPTPALPLITAAGRDPEPLAAALARAVAALDPAGRETLCLTGIARIPAEAYLALPLPTPPPG